MNKVLYLVHATYGFDENWKELKPSPIDKIEHQFSGVYMSIITKDNIDSEELYGNDDILIFSKRLLEQENYHINIRDYNGFINEKNTYFPWNLDKAVEKLKKRNEFGIGHEIIFHDAIPFKYLCMRMNLKGIDEKISVNKLLPRIEIYNQEPPDLSKIPFYCVPLEDNYTGIGKFKISSKKFYERMAILCNVDKNKSRKEIISEIKEKMLELYKNRQEQKLKEFKEFYNNQSFFDKLFYFLKK